MNLALRSPEAGFGFGAVRTSAAASRDLPARLEEGRSGVKERHFNDHLDDSLAAPLDDSDDPTNAPADAAGVTPYAPHELQEPVASGEDAAADASAIADQSEQADQAKQGGTPGSEPTSGSADGVTSEQVAAEDQAAAAQAQITDGATGEALDAAGTPATAPTEDAKNAKPTAERGADATSTPAPPPAKASVPAEGVAASPASGSAPRAQEDKAGGVTEDPGQQWRKTDTEGEMRTQGQAAAPFQADETAQSFTGEGEPEGQQNQRDRSSAQESPAVRNLRAETTWTAAAEGKPLPGPDVAPLGAAVGTPALGSGAALAASVVTRSAEPTPQGTVASDTTERIVQSLRMQYQRGGGDAIVHIRPEHLGPVSISLRVENGVVSAVVNAENPAVAEWLKANEHLLREGLHANGLHLERFAVQRDGHPSHGSRRDWTGPQRRDQPRRLTQPDSTFEVTV